MAQGKLGHGIDVFQPDRGCPAPCGMGTRSAQPDQIGAQAIHRCSETALADLLQSGVIQRNRRQAHTGTLATLAQFILLRLPPLKKHLRIGIEG